MQWKGRYWHSLFLGEAANLLGCLISPTLPWKESSATFSISASKTLCLEVN